MTKKSKASGSSQRAENHNYYLPLQTLDVNDCDDDDVNDNEETIIDKSTKIKIPPLTILKCKIEQIHELCRILKIVNYSIRKISIGIKLFLTNKNDVDLVSKSLSENLLLEFFTYVPDNEKPYKAILLGLEKADPNTIKANLISMGLKCIDVKLVVNKSKEKTLEHIIYVVYFQRKSITLRELRQNYSAIKHIKVRWEYQKPNQGKITQCYNCQMFGHGSSRCKVKTFCAHCAENHKTSECKSTIEKCANCSGQHKSTSPECPNRIKYLEIRERYKPQNRTRQNVQFSTNSNFQNVFPNTLNQPERPSVSGWNRPQSGNNTNNNLFSIEEMKNLTIELISNLSKCKTKSDQFEVITSLAFKFLY